jgi:hypothetical protein
MGADKHTVLSLCRLRVESHAPHGLSLNRQYRGHGNQLSFWADDLDVLAGESVGLDWILKRDVDVIDGKV